MQKMFDMLQHLLWIEIQFNELDSRMLSLESMAFIENLMTEVKNEDESSEMPAIDRRA